MARERQGNSPGEKKLEQYGVWVKVRPREVTATLEADDSFELTDLESKADTAAAPGQPEGALTAEEEELLDELEGELGEGSGSRPVAIPDEEPLLSETEDLPDIESIAELGEEDDSLKGKGGEAVFEGEGIPQLEEADLSLESVETEAGGPGSVEQVEVPLSESVDVKDHFEDLENLETELTNVAAAVPSPSAASSVEILARIEEELRSIRSDLSQLRNELNGLSKTVKKPVDEEAPQGAPPQGFFNEEEDETIALTGDELDNILNTAEITEEAAAAPQDTLAEAMEALEAPAEETGPESEDILSYETPVINLEEEKPRPSRAPAPPPASSEVELEEAVPTLEVGEPQVVEEAMDLDSAAPAEELIELEEESPTSGAAPQEEELPSELVFEELPTDKLSESAEAVPEIDLEAIPEIEELPSPTSVETPAEETPDRSDETIDLDSLDLGEEPTVIQAPEETLDALEDVESAEDQAVAAEPEEEQAVSAESLDTLDEGIDLETLSAEVSGPLEQAGPPSTEDLEIDELEPTGEPVEAGTASEPIEIDFEQESGADELPAEASAEDLVDLEQEPQEAPAEAAPAEGEPTSGPASGAIPDNLKDEIRTVLKYMDTLLEGLPDDKIQEFASSDYFVMYKKLFEDLGIGD